MRNFDIWTCGQSAWRLKDTSRLGSDGQYQLLSAEHVFNDYRLSTNDQVALPEPEVVTA
jgi:nitronate monooxygenase